MIVDLDDYFSRQMKTITSVATQGAYSTNNWVTGYYLYYSADGQRWTPLTENIDSIRPNVSICNIC